MKRGNGFLFLLLVIIYLVALGFWRDHVFVSVNYQIAKLHYHDTFDYELPPDMKWIERFTEWQLYWGKFPLTLLFSVLYLLPAHITIVRFFGRGIQLRITYLSYLSVFLFSLLLFATGYFAGGYTFFYTIARYLMGFLESPLLLMILFIGFQLRYSKDG